MGCAPLLDRISPTHWLGPNSEMAVRDMQAIMKRNMGVTMALKLLPKWVASTTFDFGNVWPQKAAA